MKSIESNKTIRNLLLLMSHKSRPTRSSHQNATRSLKEITNKLTKLQIATKKDSVRRFSAKSFTIDQLVDSLKAGRYKRVVVLAGAGISTPSGIPDFRTPGTGLYDNLQRYNIPYPEAIFELSYFNRNPKPFFDLAKELYPGNYFPNTIHHFVRYLSDRNLLHRIYTQNIDGLERMAGIPADKIVEAHGTFLTATCQRCRQKYDCEEIRRQIFDDQIPKCHKTKRCNGVVKPDIVFFGEDLPRRFQLYVQDLPMCDCCIVMGTSLAVYPFADIVDSTARSTPRLLINRQLVGTFLSPRPYDVTLIGDLETNVKELLVRLDALGRVTELMKKENEENEEKRINRRKFSTRSTTSTAKTNERLLAAEAFLEQQRKFSTFSRDRQESQLSPQTKVMSNEMTKTMIENYNNALLFHRRRSKSALPVISPKRLSTSSSSSSDGSLNSSLSESEFGPFTFKTSTESRVLPSRQIANASSIRVKKNPLLSATLRTVL